MEQKYYRRLIFENPGDFRDSEGGNHLYVIYANKNCFRNLEGCWWQVELEIIKHKFGPNYKPKRKEISKDEFFNTVVDRLLLLKANFKIDRKLLKVAYVMEKEWWIVSLVAEFDDCYAVFEWWTDA